MPFCISLLSCLQDDAEQRVLILLTDTVHPGPGHSRQLCRPYLETFYPTFILSIPFSCVYATFPLEAYLWIPDLM